MKILVISLAGIGDAFLATPLIHELRLNFPTATIDALVRWAGARDLLESNPHLNRVHHQNLIEANPANALKCLWQLRRERYDVSFNTYPQSKIHYRFVARFIQASQRLSHAYDNSSALDRWLVNRTVPQDYALHSIENNLRLLSLLGVEPKLPTHDPEIFLSPEELKWARDFAGDPQLAGKKIVGVHVGSGKTKNLELRRWPLDNYISLLKQLLGADPRAAVLLFGGPDEREDHERILAETRPHPVQVAPSKNLRQAAALLQKCDVFLSVDTALMHLAAAVKTPAQIVIETMTFNPTMEPYRRPYVLIRNPNLQGRNLEYYRYDGRGIRGSADELLACMRAVSVEEVLRQVRKAIGAG